MSGRYTENRSGGKAEKGSLTNQLRPLFVDKVAVVPLNEPGAELDVQVAWRVRENSPAILAFMKTVRYVFRTERGSGRQDKTWSRARRA